MQKILTTLAVLLCMVEISCSSDEDGQNMRGDIYGIVTVSDTAEPMRATGVELYKSEGVLLLKTVTYNDGHYEFENLQPGYYTLKVDADGYKEVIYDVEVEAGRTARADIRLKRLNTYMTVKTDGVKAHNNGTAEFEGSYNYNNSNYGPQEQGFIYGQNRNLTRENGITVRTENNMSTTVTGLDKGNWYVMAYAKNKVGYAFGSILSFEISGDPEVTTLDVSNVSESTATLNGRIDYDGDPHYTEKGFVYSSSFSHPTVEDPQSATTKVVVSGTSNDFSANIADLTTGKIYYVRAYVKGDSQTFYGVPVNFVAETPKPYYVIDNLAVQLTDLSKGANHSDAVRICRESRVGGFDDWRLPSLGELELIYEIRNKIGGFTNEKYWASGKGGSTNTYYYVNFAYGTNNYGGYSNEYCVRAVRTVN